MRKLETNDWIILNNIIYKIYTTEYLDDMRYELLSQLKMVLDMLKDHLAYRLEQYYKSGDRGAKKLTVTAAVTEYGLTRREHTILRCLMAGEDNAAICEKLVITPNTLKKHILNIYRKMGIKNRVQLFKIVKEFE